LKDGDIEYEAEVLTGLTEENAVKQTEVELWEFVSERWKYSEEKEAYQANSRKERRERAIFNGLYRQVRAIMASDKNGVFEAPGELFELARTDEGSFNKLYEAAVKANPTLKKVETKEAITDPN
jgi:hypothetical protein